MLVRPITTHQRTSLMNDCIPNCSWWGGGEQLSSVDEAGVIKEKVKTS